MKRKTAILTVCYLCAAIAAMGLLAWLERKNAESTTRDARYQGEYTFEELCAAAGELSTALKKGELATSPGLQAALCSEAYAQSLSALTALGQLPFESQQLEKTGAFFGRAGDYANCLTRQSATGMALSKGERTNLRALSSTAAWLSTELERLRGELSEELWERSALEEKLLGLEENFPAQSALFYDGCYTQRQITPAMLSGKPEIAERDACLIAGDFLGQRSQTASVQGQTTLKIPCWYVTLGECRVLVSVAGGQVVQALCTREPGETQLDIQTALEAGEKFLTEHGYESMRLTGWELEQGSVVGAWCYEQDGVLCYPDEIKVAIALDSGELAGFDASEYITSHRRRQLSSAQPPWDDARSALDSSLTVEEEGMAVIASPGGEEKLCMRFLCRDEHGQGCLVFCSAATAAQERIALLREGERGVSTM